MYSKGFHHPLALDTVVAQSRPVGSIRTAQDQRTTIALKRVEATPIITSHIESNSIHPEVKMRYSITVLRTRGTDEST